MTLSNYCSKEKLKIPSAAPPRLIPLEIIAKAIRKEHLLKGYRTKGQDLLIDRFKHMSVTSKAGPKECKGGHSFEFSNSLALFPEGPQQNLFYHPYPFKPQLVNKHYNPHVKKYSNLLPPQQEMKDISVPNDFMINATHFSKAIRLGSYGVSDKDCSLQLNAQYIPRKFNANQHNSRRDIKVSKAHIASTHSDLGCNENKQYSDSISSYIGMTNKPAWGHQFPINESVSSSKSMRKYSLMNNEIMKRNNRITINCVNAKIKECLPRKKIFISSSLSQNLFFLQKEKSYSKSSKIGKTIKIINKRKPKPS